MKRNHITIGLFCLLLYPGLLLSQADANNNTAAAIKKAVGFFYSSINENSGLYNGSEYIMYDQHIKGTPYFMDGQQTGSVLYNGTLYSNVPLIYETTTGNVVIREFGEGVFINLINEKVNYFTLLNHTFIHLVPDSTDKVINEGYYDRLYNGACAVYVKRQKLIYEDPHTFEKSFVENNHYYIYKNNTYHSVGGRGSVLNVFKDKKKDIVKYMRQNDIDFKKDPEYAMAKMAEYYDKLTH